MYPKHKQFLLSYESQFIYTKHQKRQKKPTYKCFLVFMFCLKEF